SAASVAVIDTRPIVTTYKTNTGKTRAVPLTGDYPCVSRYTSARVISSMRLHTKVHGLSRKRVGNPPAGRSHWIRSSTRPRATMWWLDLAYAPHLRPEGRRRLFALDAPRCLFC